MKKTFYLPAKDSKKPKKAKSLQIFRFFRVFRGQNLFNFQKLAA